MEPLCGLSLFKFCEVVALTTTAMIQKARQLLAANESENGLNLDFDSRLVAALENAKFDLLTYGTSAVFIGEPSGDGLPDVRHVDIPMTCSTAQPEKPFDFDIDLDQLERFKAEAGKFRAEAEKPRFMTRAQFRHLFDIEPQNGVVYMRDNIGAPMATILITD